MAAGGAAPCYGRGGHACYYLRLAGGCLYACREHRAAGHGFYRTVSAGCLMRARPCVVLARGCSCGAPAILTDMKAPAGLAGASLVTATANPSPFRPAAALAHVVEAVAPEATVRYHPLLPAPPAKSAAQSTTAAARVMEAAASASTANPAAAVESGELPHPCRRGLELAAREGASPEDPRGRLRVRESAWLSILGGRPAAILCGGVGGRGAGAGCRGEGAKDWAPARKHVRRGGAVSGCGGCSACMRGGRVVAVAAHRMVVAADGHGAAFHRATLLGVLACADVGGAQHPVTCVCVCV